MKLTRHPWKQVEFELYKDNEPTGKIYILNDANNWYIEEWLDDAHEWDFREINIPRGYTPKYRTYEDDGVRTYSVRNISPPSITLTIECLFIDIDEKVRPSIIEFTQRDDEGNKLYYNYGETNTFNIVEDEINLIEPIKFKNVDDVDINNFVAEEGGLYDYVKTIKCINENEYILKFVFFPKSGDYVKKDELQNEFYSKTEINALIDELKENKNVDEINKLNRKIQKIARDVDNLNNLLTLIIKNSN